MTRTPHNGLAFDAIGDGSPLILVHGFPLSRRAWRGVLSAMGESERAYAVDLPGFGASNGNAPASLEELADAVVSFADERGIDRFVLAGLSMGGYVALAVAERTGHRLAGLVMVDSKSEADTPDARGNRDRMIEVVRQKGSDAIADLMLPKMLAPERLAGGGAVADDLVAIMRACPAATIEKALAAMRDRPDRTDVVRTLAVPLLAICGEHDPLTPPGVMAAMASQALRGRLKVIPNAGHMAPMESPHEVAGVLREFVRDCFR